MKMKTIILITLLILTIYIGSVSAANDTAIDHTLMGNDESNQVEISNTEDSKEISVINKNSKDIENNILTNTVHQFNGTTFSELKTKINSISSGDTIVLNNNIEQDMFSYITINKDIIIEGNNHTIDGKNKSVFYFSDGSNNVEIRNINFINYKNECINAYNCNLTMYACVFNNTLNSSEHAVFLYSSKPSNFSIINCNFLANPRALYISGDYLFLSYCNFTKNSLAIDCNAHIFGEINNCIFMNNTNLKSQMIAFNYGGFRNSTYNISNCVFMNNTGVDDKFIYFGASNSNMSNCIFVNNNEIGSNNGGLLVMTGSNCTLYNCSFINNTSNEGAGLCVAGSNSTIDNCTFINNTVATYRAGAIHWYCHDGSIINSKFLNNPGNDGSSIFLSYPCRLINNTNNNFVLVFNGATKYIPCTVTIMDNSTINATIFKPITLNMLIQPNDPVYHLSGYFDLNFVIDGNKIQVHTGSISYVFNKDGNFTISFNSTYLTNVTVNTALVHVMSGDFGYLRQLINQVNEGGVFNLTRDYVFTDGLDQVIRINKSITINGNGHIIDARGKSNIFELTTPCEVVLNNITFLNSNDKTINIGSNSCVNISILNCKFINSTGSYDIYGSNTKGNLYLHNNTMKKVIYYTDTILSKVYVSVQDNSTSFVQFNKSVNIKINLWDDNNNTLNPSFNCVRLLLDNGTSFRPNTMMINTLRVSCTFKECRNFTLSVTSEYLKNMTIFTGCVDVRIGDYYYLQRLIDNASDGDVINLTRDYNRFPEIDDYSVIINKENLTINGNGHVINAGGKAQIFRCNAKGVTLKNITFTNSSSWAVYLNGANQTIDHCNFVNMNSYSNVVQVSGVNNIISNCYFSNTHSTNYNDIFLNSGSSCYLKNNTGSKIYSNGGDILSKTNIIILDNSTVYNNNQNKTRITAIITDDNNNKIGSNYLVNYFVLDNGTRITTTLDRDEMFYYAEYLFADYEDYIISSQNRRENLVNVSIFNATVCIREYANISVSTSPIIYGENASFIINITDSDIALGEILLSIGQHNYIINLNDTYTGLITYNVAGLTPDDYEVKVNYTSPYLYGEVVANTILHVSKAEFELNVNVVEGNGSIPTIFNVTCPEDFDGNISIEINGQTEYIPITKGKGSVEIILPYGYYNGLIKAFNSALYNNTNTTCNVHIRDNPNLSVSDDTIIYPENATIIIKLLDVVRGNIILSIGEYNTTIELNDSFTGIINFNMPNLTPDTYDIQVNYTGSEYFTESIVKSTLTVYKAEFELNVNITIGDSNIPTKFNVTCPADFDGYVIVEVNDNSYLVSLTHGKGSVDIIIPKGDYISVIKTINSKLYNDTNITHNLHIMDNPNLNVDCEPIKYGENATITIKLENDVRGYIILNVGEYNTTIILNDSFTGTITRIIPNLTPNTYIIKVNYTGDEYYKSNVIYSTLKVNKAPVNIITDIDKGNNTVLTKIAVNLPGDFNGNVNVKINDETYNIPIINNTGSINVNLTSGNYTLEFIAFNSLNYMDTKLNENLHIVTPLSEDVFEIPLNISEGIVNFEVNGLPGDANGYFMVVINGLTAQSVDVVNGNVTPININLTSGEYNITMIFADKGEYGVVFKSTNITVGSKDPVITIIDNKDVSVSYSGKATYSVHILSGGVDVVDGENVTIVFNGINNVVKTLNGYASLALNTAVAVGKYTIVAEYKNKTVSNSVSILNIINTNNLKTLKKSKKVNKVKISLAQVDGMYLRGKTIVLKIKGKKVASAKTNSKGVATLKIKKKSLKKFKAGKYVANVSYGLDRVDKTIKIK